MKTEKVLYKHGDQQLEGHVAYDPAIAGRRPLVLVAHAWAGQSDFERSKAEDLAKLGYVGFALDVYGKGVLGTDKDECSKLMTPFMQDRVLLQQRLLAGLDAAKQLSMVDTSQLGAIGFCFGGLCVLDLARSGIDIGGVVSFHGLLKAPDLAQRPRIRAKILALHGFDDPMAPPEQMVEFGKEMTAAGADWQIHAYGNTMHAFTNPGANDPGFGTVYQPTADRRSWLAMKQLFIETFGQ